MKVTKDELIKACEEAFKNGCEDKDDLVTNGTYLLMSAITGKKDGIQDMVDAAIARLKKDVTLDFE